MRLSVKQIPNGAAGSNPAPPSFFVLPNAAPTSFHIKDRESFDSRASDPTGKEKKDRCNLFLPRKRPPREMNSALRKNLIWGGAFISIPTGQKERIVIRRVANEGSKDILCFTKNKRLWRNWLYAPVLEAGIYDVRVRVSPTVMLSGSHKNKEV